MPRPARLTAAERVAEAAEGLPLVAGREVTVERSAPRPGPAVAERWDVPGPSRALRRLFAGAVRTLRGCKRWAGTDSLKRVDTRIMLRGPSGVPYRLRWPPNDQASNIFRRTLSLPPPASLKRNGVPSTVLPRVPKAGNVGRTPEIRHLMVRESVEPDQKTCTRDSPPNYRQTLRRQLRTLGITSRLLANRRTARLALR